MGLFGTDKFFYFVGLLLNRSVVATDKSRWDYIILRLGWMRHSHEEGSMSFW